MKTKLLIGFAALAFALVAAFNINLNSKDNAFSALSLADVEALGDCEITNSKGKVVFKCVGGGNCEDSSWGYTLTCSGTQVSI